LKSVLSVKLLAWKLLEKLCEESDSYEVRVEETSSGTRIVDAGIRATGGFRARLFTQEVLAVNNVKTGNVFKAGEINADASMRSFGFTCSN